MAEVGSVGVAAGGVDSDSAAAGPGCSAASACCIRCSSAGESASGSSRSAAFDRCAIHQAAKHVTATGINNQSNAFTLDSLRPTCQLAAYSRHRIPGSVVTEPRSTERILVNNLPFGFGAEDGTPEDPDANGKIPGMPDGFDMAGLGAALQQLGSLIQSGGAGAEGPVNWTLTHDVARKKIAEDADPTVSDAQLRAVADAVALADVWLDPAMQFPATGGEARTWSRSEWLEGTLPAWKTIVTPVAEHLQSSMQSVMPDQNEMPGLPEGLPPELAAMAGPLMDMARQMGSSMFGMQLGQGLAALASDVLSSSEIGIPLTSDSRPTLLPHNIHQFGDGLEVPQSDLLVYLALREVAHQRLFHHVPWLRGRIEGAIEAYARGIHVDQRRIEDAMQGVNMENPEALQDALSAGVFEPVDTEEQKAAKARLESLLAMIEGWVDDVVTTAASDKLPSFDQLREALRRRRASGGPAEKTFATLIGLEMRPRRLREAADVWRQLRESPGGIEARDALWEHPDLLPSAEDLENTTGFVGTTDQFSALDIDKELSDLEAKGGFESLINDADAPKENPDPDENPEAGPGGDSAS